MYFIQIRSTYKEGSELLDHFVDDDKSFTFEIYHVLMLMITTQVEQPGPETAGSGQFW
jgi:hypothetical protein